MVKQIEPVKISNGRYRYTISGDLTAWFEAIGRYCVVAVISVIIGQQSPLWLTVGLFVWILRPLFYRYFEQWWEDENGRRI